MFKNEENLELIYENKEIVKSICEFVQLLDEYCQKESIIFGDGYEKTMQIIMKSIVSYGKEACNCMERGDFYGFAMITRAIIENYIIFVTIGENEEEELWKYWIAWSFCNVLKRFEKNNSSKVDSMKELLVKYFEANKIHLELLEDKAFFNDYGWAVIEGKRFKRYQLADMIDESINSDYKELCDYNHGVSVLQKQITFTFDATFINIVAKMFMYLEKTTEYYFGDIDNGIIAHIYELLENFYTERGY